MRKVPSFMGLVRETLSTLMCIPKKNSANKYARLCLRLVKLFANAKTRVIN